jgi:DnaJ homolog subfamily A member 2
VLEVYVEKGSPDGHKVIFYGKADEQPEVETGNIVFTLKTKEHPVFTRKNADLFVKKTITLGEALTGFEFELTQLDGRKLLVL